MRRTRLPLTAFLATLFLALPSVVPSATTCVEMPPLKPLHRICGVVFFPSGDRIANATVSVLEGDKEIAAKKTDDDGKFSFDQLKAGHYELRIRVDGVPGIASTKVVLTRVNIKSKQEIAVNIFLRIANCSSFSLVDTKKFEVGVNPNNSE